MTERGLHLLTVQPDRDTYRMAYDVVSNSTLVVLAPPPLRPGPAATLRPPLGPGLGGLPRVQRALRRGGGRGRRRGRHRARAGLPPEPPPRGAGREAARPPHRPLHPHALRQPRHAAGAALGRWPARSSRAWRRATACGFHTARWEAGFRGCCAGHGRRPGPHLRVAARPRTPTTWSSGPRRRSAWRRASGSTSSWGAGAWCVRVDRIEPAKNLLRGFWAFDEMLRMRPELRGEVVLLALAYASRSTLPEYLAYGAEVEHAARAGERHVGHRRLGADHPRRGRRPGPVDRRPDALRRPAREPAARRAQPRRQGRAPSSTRPTASWRCRAKRAPSPSCTPKRSRSTPST